MFRKTTLLLLLILFSLLSFAQDNEPILPAQADAIRTLTAAKGFSTDQWNQYLADRHGKEMMQLSRKEASDIIRQLQSDDPPKPVAEQVQKPVTPPSVTPTVQKSSPPTTQDRSPLIAQYLEPGMSKRFHLVDGNIIHGTILKIDGDICHLETTEGVLKIPTKDILEETAEVTKRDESRYVGPVIKETLETISIHSKYGDVVIEKRDIQDMNRFHGGKLVPWAEEKKRFYRGAVSLTDIFDDPTAFPLEAHAMYISGLSIGYGFTDHFMVHTSFGNNFNGDLNLRPLYQFYNERTANSRSGIAIGANLYSRHDMSATLANRSKYIRRRSDKILLSDPRLAGIPASQALNPEYNTAFFAVIYIVYSKLWAQESGRGEMGYHFGFKTNSLPLIRDKILNSSYEWTNDNMNAIPFRAWAALEYDLTKNLKFAAEVWADNSYRYRTLTQVRHDYLSDSTPFVLDAKDGEFRTIDFDFGFLYAVNDSFRIGVHFKEAYFVFFWRILEL
jgi:hypothetical protein